MTAEVVDAIAGIVKAEVNVKDLKLVASDNEVFVKRVDPDFKRLLHAIDNFAGKTFAHKLGSDIDVKSHREVAFVGHKIP